jgi:copper(I)-binding protein
MRACGLLWAGLKSATLKSKHLKRTVAALAIATTLLSLGGCPQSPPVEILKAVAPATAPGVTVAAVYVDIVTRTDDVLLDLATPLADRTEIHESIETNGVMQMRQRENVPLQAGKPLKFAPFGLHLMLMNLHKPLQADQSFPLDLHLQKAGTVTAIVQVVPPGSLAQ